MRWLQWSSLDLNQGIGGVEVHARCVARELNKLGIDVKLSSNLADLEDPSWNIIHTHGSAPLSLRQIWRIKQRGQIYVHTLHGTTFGRMAACGEWTWIGGYLAQLREMIGSFFSSVLFAVHENLWLYQFCLKLGKKGFVCSNGWDSGVSKESLPSPIQELLTQNSKPLWLFLGRGKDRVKGADRLIQIIPKHKDKFWVAAPGDGFENCEDVRRTGPLSLGQVRTLLEQAYALVLPSRYEGLPLVVLEALTSGTNVIATDVGGMKSLSNELKGLFKIPPNDFHLFSDKIQDLLINKKPTGLANQALLLTWEKVARNYLEGIKNGLHL